MKKRYYLHETNEGYAIDDIHKVKSERAIFVDKQEAKFVLDYLNANQNKFKIEDGKRSSR